jgi:hypothetical protein
MMGTLIHMMRRRNKPENEGHQVQVSTEEFVELFVHVAHLMRKHPSLKELWLWHGN